MLKIKLARFGKRNQPHYRFVVTEARSKRDGKYNASLGHYAPTQSPKILEIDVKAYDEWVDKGAQPTETVAALYKKFKSGNPFPAKKQKPSKKKLAAANKPKEAAPQTKPVEEKPAEETISPEANDEKTAVAEKTEAAKPEEKAAAKSESTEKDKDEAQETTEDKKE